MKKVIPLALLASLTLAACPKRAETNVAGSDEEMLDRHSTRLEELRTRLEAESPPCPDVCSMNEEVCDLAKKICDIAGRQPERLQGRCVSAQEDCAKFGDACTTCRGR